jgi:hypothetical protein
MAYGRARCKGMHGATLHKFRKARTIGSGIEILIVPSGLNSTEQCSISINQYASPIGLIDDDGRSFSLPD